MNQQTIIIGGNFRGGTTAVTTLVEGAGIFIGDHLGTINKEDLEFQQILYGNNQYDISRLHELIQDRNSRFDVWAFKYPGVHYNLMNWLYLVRNPKIVYVLRDPVAVAISELTRNKAGAFEELMRRANTANWSMIVQKGGMPDRVHILSFERLLTRTERTIEELFSFLDIEADIEKLAGLIGLGPAHYVGA